MSRSVVLWETAGPGTISWVSTSYSRCACRACSQRLLSAQRLESPGVSSRRFRGTHSVAPTLSTGCATGALIAIIVLGSSPTVTGVGALLGGLVSGAVILACAGGMRVTGIRVVLVGIGCSAALRAVNSLLIVKAPLEAAQRAQLWSAGSFSGVTIARLMPLLIVIGAVVVVCAVFAVPLGLVAMGDDVATGLGVRVRRTRVLLIVVAILLVASATSVAGPVAFVALAAPHVAHRLCGGGGVGFTSSALVGALLVLVSDVCAQRLVAPAELPVGVVTGVVGGVYLLWLLIREVRS